jgi:hypothetical protein
VNVVLPALDRRRSPDASMLIGSMLFQPIFADRAEDETYAFNVIGEPQGCRQQMRKRLGTTGLEPG